MSGHWKDGRSELDIGGVGGGFGGGGAGRRSRSGMMLGLQVMTARAKELVIMSAAVGARGIINGLLEASRAERSPCGEGGRRKMPGVHLHMRVHVHMCTNNAAPHDIAHHL